MCGWQAQDYHSQLDVPIGDLIVAPIPQDSLAIENITYVPRLDKTCQETIPARHKLPQRLKLQSVYQIREEGWEI